MNPIGSVKRPFAETPSPTAHEPKKAKVLEREIVDQKISAFNQRYERLLERAATNKDIDAVRILGDLCLQGRDKYGVGRIKDNYMAFLYFRHAAEKGNGKAMYTLARLYERGIGIFRNDQIASYYYKKAFSCLKELAKVKGKDRDIGAQFRVAEMYRKGNGVIASPQKAYKWYETVITLDSTGKNKGYYASLASEGLEKMMTSSIPEYSDYVTHLARQSSNDKGNLLCMLARSHQLVAKKTAPIAALEYLHQAILKHNSPKAWYQLGRIYEVREGDQYKEMAQGFFESAAKLGHQRAKEKIKAETLR